MTHRVSTILSHLTPEIEIHSTSSKLSSKSSVVDQKALMRYLDGHHHEFRQGMYKMLEDKLWQPRYNLTVEDQRELAMERAKAVAASQCLLINEVEDDPLRYLACNEAMIYGDPSTGTKVSVQYGLFGLAIFLLGNESQKEAFVPKAQSLDILGCFALTELGHGSNVQGILTEASYDSDSEEFVINTPCTEAQKYWIGGAMSAEWAVVFAQLKMGDEDHGVHPFLVRLRSSKGALMKGIKAADCGRKMGLNGVDNGRLWFDKVRIPRTQLLDRYGGVDANGKYTSVFGDHKLRRFGRILLALVIGRVATSVASQQIAKLGLTTAIRYGASRTQFGDPEFPILDYLTHQRRLYPLLATTVGIVFTNARLKQVMATAKSDAQYRELHMLASGMKAVSSWNMRDSLQQSRECCGGAGFSSASRIGDFKSDTDVYLTFEGDNTVLMQQVAKGVMSKLRKQGPIVDETEDQNPEDSSDKMLLSAKWQIHAFRAREAFYADKMMNQMMEKMGEGMDTMAAWNSILDVVLKTAQANVDREMLEDFVKGVEGCGHSGNRSALNELRCLFALWRMDNDPWFVRYYYTAEKAECVERLVNECMGRFHGDAVDFVNGFGIPEHCLGWIAKDWVEYSKYENVPSQIL